MPDVSILMAVYNALPYLPDAVDSIRRQTLKQWTFVIIDDGSTDGSSEYLDQLDDSRIQVVHTPNRGLGAALNRGLELCQTEFVARMDSDDVAHPTRLQEQLEFLKKQPEVGLLGSQIEELGSVRVGPASSLATEHRSIYANLMKGRAAICHPTIMCRTALLKEIGGYPIDCAAQDWDMYLRMGERAELAVLDRVLLSYRIHAESISSSRMVEARWRVAFAAECARRRNSGRAAIGYEEFMAKRRAAPPWRRIASAVDLYARRQYRVALAEILGAHRLRGYVRLAWAATCQPVLTLQRITRVLRKKLTRPKVPTGTATRDGTLTAKEGSGEPIMKNTENEDRRFRLLGVEVTDATSARAIELLEQTIRQRDGSPRCVFFVNAHTLNLAAADGRYRQVLNTADYVFRDGTGVRWAARLQGIRVRDNLVGTDLAPALLSTKNGRRYSYFLLGADQQTIGRAAKYAQETFPHWIQAGHHHGYISDPEITEAVIEQINAAAPDVLLVGMGNPIQECWVHRHRHKLRVAVCLATGGLFSYWAGNMFRAPRWLRSLGHEWLWILCQQPLAKARRYLIGNPLFLARVLVHTLKAAGSRRQAAGGRHRPRREVEDHPDDSRNMKESAP